MKIKPAIFGVVTVLVFLGIIWTAQASGFWSVSGKVDASGKAIGPDPENVETIKGWMTLGQIADAYGVQVEDIKAVFSLPADVSADTAVKDLESETFETSALREWLAAGMLPGEVIATEPAAEQQTVPTPQPAVTQAVEEAVTTETHEPVDRMITGKTTFQQLLDWGLSREVVEEVLGMPFPPAGMVIKDYLTGQGQEFGTVKGLLQAELDKLP